MLLHLKVVVGLVTATLAAAESAGNFSIPLTRRQDPAQIGEDQIATFSGDFSHAVIKYSTALENYFRNTGKQHPLQALQLSKRGSEGSVGLRNVDNGLLWTGQVQFGFPPQSVYVDFDTGSADMLVNHGAYNPGLSISSHNTKKSFSSTYSDGRKANGTIYTDDFSIGGIKGKHVAVGLSKKEFIASRESPNKGISGLSMPSIQTFPSSYKPFFQTLREQGAVSQGIFQFTIRLAVDRHCTWVVSIHPSTLEASHGWTLILRMAFTWPPPLSMERIFALSSIRGRPLLLAPRMRSRKC